MLLIYADSYAEVKRSTGDYHGTGVQELLRVHEYLKYWLSFESSLGRL